MRKNIKNLTAFLLAVLLAAVCVFADSPIFGSAQQEIVAADVLSSGPSAAWSAVDTAELSITQQPADASAAVGAIVSTTVKASGVGLTYTWYVCDSEEIDFVRSSITKSTYSCTMTAARDGRRVYCVVTDAYGESVKSSIAVLAIE